MATPMRLTRPIRFVAIFFFLGLAAFLPNGIPPNDGVWLLEEEGRCVLIGWDAYRARSFCPHPAATVFRPTHLRASMIAGGLGIAGVVATGDNRTNKLCVAAEPATVERIGWLIRLLDVPLLAG